MKNGALRNGHRFTAKKQATFTNWVGISSGCVSLSTPAMNLWRLAEGEIWQARRKYHHARVGVVCARQLSTSRLKPNDRFPPSREKCLELPVFMTLDNANHRAIPVKT